MRKISIIIAVVLVGGGLIWALTKPAPKTANENINVVANVNNHQAVNAAPENSNQSAGVVSTPAKYVSYSSEAETTARASGGKTVLYFHADWCPICQLLEPDIRKNINQFPSGLTVLKVNYETATELKRKYGVTYQHTFVQIDDQGNLIKIWSGGTTSDSLISQLN